MKLRSSLVIACSLAVGYVVGTAAGRQRFDQLKSRVTGVLRDPKVQQTVFNLADQVQASDHIPAPVAGLVDAAATRVQDSLTEPDEADAPPATS